MNNRPNKRPAPGNSDRAWGFAIAAILGVGVLAGPAYAGWRVGGRSWTATAIAAAAGLYLLLLAVVVVIVVAVVRWRRKREWTDDLARSMSGRRDTKEMTAKAAQADTQRLGSTDAGLGVPLGVSISTGQWLYGLYEWSQVWILGTRAGKSRSVAIPQIMTHLGALVTTSNKRDVVDRTRGRRSELGRVWVNDPQLIAKEPPSWWWNVISFVTTVERADKLVDVWSAARSVSDLPAQEDAYFEPEGRKVLATLLVAARLGDQLVTRLPDWATGRPPEAGVPDPRMFLRAAGLETMANDLTAWWRLDDGQRDGVFGTARSFLGFLRDPRFVAWMTPAGPGGVARREFDPAAFVRSTDSLYLLSKEGAGSARALTAALTVAVYTATEDYAEESGDRVPTPILFVLDEAANVCRWPELPNLYSHAGGKGIILIVILQSRAQGERAWGKDGFAMMWSAANIAAVGRGINDDQHLTALTRLIGDRQVSERQRSVGSHGHRSTSTSNRDEVILSEADLRALPRGRAVLFASGARPILLRLVDYSLYQDWGWLCGESLSAFGPGGTDTATAPATVMFQPLSAAELTSFEALTRASAWTAEDPGASTDQEPVTDDGSGERAPNTMHPQWRQERAASSDYARRRLGGQLNPSADSTHAVGLDTNGRSW